MSKSLKTFFKEVLDQDTYTAMEDFQKEIDNIFNEVYQHRQSPVFESFKGNYPKANVIEKEKEIVIVAATPGLDKSEISVEIKDNVLTIKGESKQEKLLDEKETYICRELKKSNFLRSFRLSTSKLDINNVTTSYNNGELSINIPKRESAKKKSIKVNIE